MSFRIRHCSCAILLTTFLGCGSDHSVVSGKVTYQGKPLICGTVSYHFDDNTMFSGGISPDGNYYIPTCGRGHARVTVTTSRPPAIPANLGRGDPPDPKTTPDPSKWFEIPSKYGNPETSSKEVNVSAGRNSIDITLD